MNTVLYFMYTELLFTRFLQVVWTEKENAVVSCMDMTIKASLLTAEVIYGPI